MQAGTHVIALAFSLLALGISDLVAGGLAGQPARPSRIAAGAASAALVMAGHCASAGWSFASLVLAAAVLVGGAAWQVLRMGRPSERRAGAAVAFLLVLLGSLVVFAPVASGTVPAGLVRFASASPVPVIGSRSVETLLTGLGMLVVLAATTNGVVRTVLRASGTRLEASEATLRGGRLIGVIERWLIFALVAGGAPTAAALAVSAKSLVRFPELSSARTLQHEDARDPAGAREIDYVTEYFLLGSLLSWSAAVLAVSLLPR